MNLARLTRRASFVLRTCVNSPASIPIPLRNLHTTTCGYAERKYTKKVFTPAFGNEEVVKVVEEEVVDKRKTESDIYAELKKEQKKVRTFSKIDKMILVMIGKYKNLKDVPDQVTYSTLDRKKEVDVEMKQLFLGSTFKYVYLFEYCSLFLTGSILIFAVYWYNRVKKSSQTASAEAASEQSDS